MNEFCAIMGLLNLEHIEEAILDRKRVAKEYTKLLGDRKGIRIFEQDLGNITSNYAYYPVLITEESNYTRDEIYIELTRNGIFARKYFYPVTADQSCFNNKYRNINIPVARRLSDRILVLPIYEGLSNEDVDRIVKYL